MAGARGGVGGEGGGEVGEASGGEGGGGEGGGGDGVRRGGGEVALTMVATRIGDGDSAEDEGGEEERLCGQSARTARLSRANFHRDCTQRSVRRSRLGRTRAGRQVWGIDGRY